MKEGGICLPDECLSIRVEHRIPKKGIGKEKEKQCGPQMKRGNVH